MDLPEKKSILLISHNFSPEPTGIGKYNGEMIHWLSKRGYECTVITTFPYYPYWKVQPPYKNRWYKKELINYQGNSGNLTIYRCPSYVPSNPTGRKRILQDFSFWSSMFWRVLQLQLSGKQFDLIITVAPPFHLAYLGLLVKKSSGAKLLYHVQDLQIEAAQDLNMLSSQKLFNKIYRIEKDILEKADYVSSISEGMITKIQAKVEKKVLFFPNWVDTSYFFPLPNRDNLKSKWGYAGDDFVCLYSGAIGEKQGLESILNVAQILIDNKKIKFIICGSGPYKERLIETANERNLVNVTFLPVQDKSIFNEFLNMADLHLILQKANASDLVMPSKLTTILAVGGVSMVTAPPATSLFNLINKYDVGYVIHPEDDELLATKIRNAKSGADFEIKAANARNYALKYLNIDNVMDDFVKSVLK
ncbi:WcaI family glycosyltransferase [Mucilaginibacter sabulilitoris]|uniref:WcaI family glycosyltransferase n=1 Tax=Mucilaginibacter sabulilitoris TaxID=1173583 RepID=A0ABZ0TR63_9SPHI|nr:WcaI family glycosyltransferase [Mucilaginibacter sabulilitoris]WPU95621.1 WcaI family glycosyltransferase [Mucilaginibacter sabulilitoris]